MVSGEEGFNLLPPLGDRRTPRWLRRARGLRLRGRGMLDSQKRAKNQEVDFADGFDGTDHHHC